MSDRNHKKSAAYLNGIVKTVEGETLDYLEIEGGSPLCGEVRIQGSKNAVLPILSAALLNPGITVIDNCPDISDVKAMLEILKGYGCRTHREGDSLVLNAEQLHSGRAPEDYAGVMRSSIMLLGSLLARLGEAFLPYPGGCVIGERPIDLHLTALRKMGARLREEPEGLKAVCARPQGADISLPFPSVGATENIILLAVRAEGDTLLQNAAREPEIVELCRFLNCMGAKIKGAGTSVIRIRGVKTLHEIRYRIMPDRIVAGTYMFLAAAAGGKILLRDVPFEQLEAVRHILKRMGIRQERSGKSLLLWCPARCRGGIQVCTSPYPGFPTDLQSPLTAALCLADGESMIEERIFEARFKVVKELQKMGADIRIDGSRACIRGVERLKGEVLEAEELRGGAALCVAAAAAEGTSRIYQYHYIARGYENIIRDLNDLGVVVHCF